MLLRARNTKNRQKLRIFRQDVEKDDIFRDFPYIFVNDSPSHRILNPMQKNILKIHLIQCHFQSKTLTPKNKNKIFPKFLSSSITTTYNHLVHSGKSRTLFSISIDFSTKIWYNTHILANRLTKHARKRSYRPDSQVTGSADPDS